MQWKTIALILLTAVIGVGTISYTDLFGGILQITGVNYTHTGDIKCGDTCEIFLNVTTSYYQLCFEHSNRSDVIYQKTALSRTLWVNLQNVKNIITTNPEREVDWLVPTVGVNKWRPVKDGDCWVRGKVNKNKLVGHKDPKETVKWGFQLTDKTKQYILLDPKWEGTGSESKHKFTINSELDSENRQVIIYPTNAKFADDKGTLIEKAKSLKGVYTPNIQLDPRFNIILNDFNNTWYDVCVASSETGQIPLRINLLTNRSQKQLDIKISNTALQANKWRCFNFTVPTSVLDYAIEWGWNSSNISIPPTSGIGTIGVQQSTTWQAVHDATIGDVGGVFTTGTHSIETCNDSLFGVCIYRGFFPLNKSVIAGQTIIKAALCVYMPNSGVAGISDQDNDGYDFISIVGPTSQANVYSLAREDYDQCGNITNPIEYSVRKDLTTDFTTVAWNCFDFNSAGLAYLNNGSDMLMLGLREGHDTLNHSMGKDLFNYIFINLTGIHQPFYNLTYSTYNLSILGPITTNPLNVSYPKNISINFSMRDNGTAITTGVTSLNLTIGGMPANNLYTSSACTGTLDCTVYGVQSACQNCSQCSWIVGGVENNTKKTCTGVWNSSCRTACATELDNTFDTCNNCAGADEQIREVYLNLTSTTANSWINVTCEYDSTETVNDEIYIYYKNTSAGTWMSRFAGNTAGTGGANRNFSVKFQVNNVLGVHQVRCIIDYDGEVDECADSGSYRDNDDANFTVITTAYSCTNNGDCASCGLNYCGNCSSAGCYPDSNQQFGYAGSWWQWNVSVPNFAAGSGKKDVSINITYSSITFNTSQGQAIDYGTTIVGGDPCTPPTTGTFNVTSWCNFTSTYQISGDINCSSTGIMNISGTLNFTGTNQRFIMMDGCKRWLQGTGKWGKFQ